MMDNPATEVCILGAGPAGAAAALKLSYLGIPCTLIDKATFPRDKVCGDAISATFPMLFNRLDPAILKRFNAMQQQVRCYGIRLFTLRDITMDLPLHPISHDSEDACGFVSKREDFDNFLVEEIKRRGNITLLEGIEIVDIERTSNGFSLFDKTGNHTLDVKLLLAADGANSRFSRHYVGHQKEPKHYCGGVRAYYENVAGLSEENYIEIHFLDEVYPGYFWIFPLSHNQANVGLGMRSDFISKKKVNLKKRLDEILQSRPQLKERFKDATRINGIQGYGLPLGSKKRQLSGDHFMLLGDAGHLIDPLSGEGIGNALYSGFIAAEQAQKCLEEHNFSADFLQAYDQRIDRVLGGQLKISAYIQRSLQSKWIWKIFLSLIKGKEKRLAKALAKAIESEGEMRKLKSPLFWLQFIIGRKDP